MIRIMSQVIKAEQTMLKYIMKHAVVKSNFKHFIVDD